MKHTRRPPSVPFAPEEDAGEIVERYADMVYRLAYAQTRSKSDAEDVFQDVFLQYLKKAPAFESEEHRRAWLLRVTVNYCKRLWRSAWRRHTVPLEETIPFRQPDESALYETLGRLPKKYRLVLHLFYYETMSAEEIARTLNAKPSTVRTWLTRARRRLKHLIEEEEAE